MKASEKNIFYKYLSKGGNHSVAKIRRAIGSLGRDVEGYGGLPCDTGCSDCCEEEVRISKPEVDLLIDAIVKNVPHAEIAQIIEFAEGGSDACPLLLSSVRGCSVHGTGGKPLICMLAGLANWPVGKEVVGKTSLSNSRASVGCGRVNDYWEEQANLLQIKEKEDVILLPMGSDIYEATNRLLKKKFAGSIRQVILGNREKLLTPVKKKNKRNRRR